MCCIFRPRILVPAVILGLSGLFLAMPDTAAAGFAQGLDLCLHTLLPALFPFFVACSLVSSALGRKGGFAAALLLSWLGGYAVCAGLVRDLRLRGKLSSNHATLVLLLGCCSGPGFVVGSVGGHLLGSVRLGLVLYIAQLLANGLCAAILWPWIKRAGTAFAVLSPQPETYSVQGLSQAIMQAVDSCLCVCGTVIFFRMVQVALVRSFSLPTVLAPVLSAVLEISSGCADFALLGGKAALYGVCLCLSILGVSVFVQLQTLLNGTVSLRLLIMSRILHVPVMILITSQIVRRLPGNAAVFSSLATRVVPMNRTSPDTTLVIFLFLCAVLYKIRKKNYNKSVQR